MKTHLAQLVGDAVGLLRDAAASSHRAVVGFDGFVDEMCTVVASRLPGGAAQPVRTIAEFGSLVSGAAGRSFGRELSVKRVEPGGNAPNLAEGLMALGVGVDFYGTLGDPIDPVFETFRAACSSCVSLGACGRTLALEFEDGKLQLNRTERLGELKPTVIRAMLKETPFGAQCLGASIIGLANWSRYPHMTACWRVVLDEVLSKLAHRPVLLVDLADPSGRDAGEINGMLDLLREMTRTCRVVFGANLNESGVLLEAAGHSRPAAGAEGMEAGAARLRERCGAQMMVIHSQVRAASAWDDAAWGRGSASIDGKHNMTPVRTTGVGDRFNAGLAAALAAGASPPSAAALGCAAGSWFVTKGRALAASDLPTLTAWCDASL